MKQNLLTFSNYLSLLNHRFSIIGVSETWLTGATADLYGLDGYTFVEMHRIGKVGGVGVFISADMSFSLRDDLCCIDEICETIFIEIEKSAFGFNKKLIIGMLYRPPGKDTYCYIMGDHNINLLNYNTHIHTSDLVDLMYSSAYLPLINRPTRVTEIRLPLLITSP